MIAGTKTCCFASENDTEKWALILDGYFQLFPNKQSAEKILEKYTGQGIESSCHGTVSIVPPKYTPYNVIYNMPMVDFILSKCVETDLCVYVETEIIKRDNRVNAWLKNNLADRRGTEDWSFLNEEVLQQNRM